MEKRTGIVASYDKQFGHGLITTDTGDFYFNHRNIVMDGFRYLDPGDFVTFTIGVRGDGLQALEVQLKPGKEK